MESELCKFLSFMMKRKRKKKQKIKQPADI